MRLTRQQKFRLGLVGLLTCAFFAVVAARLVYFQIIKHSEYSDRVTRQCQGTVPIPATRGLIYDRCGEVVVDNIELSSLYAFTTSAKQRNEVNRYLERFFSLRPGSARTTYGQKMRQFHWIRRRLTDEQATDIRASAPEGLYLRQESQRTYPYGTVGKQIVGFTDIDNRGQSGLEMSFDSLVAGRAGLADVQRDGYSRTFPVEEQALVKPVAGQSIVLTVDWRLQEIVEGELKRAVIKHNAKHGEAVFVDCHNGDILAIAHYDPLEKNPERPVKLRAVTDQWEPGSIFKAITAAGVIDAGLENMDDSVYCEDGYWRMGRNKLEDDKKHGWLDFREVIELSSNIGTAKYAIQLGGDQLYETARRFGIGEKLRIGIPSASRGQLHPDDNWSDYDIAALAMGHGVAVTSVHMAAVFAAIANGGELLRPNLVMGFVDKHGYVVERERRELKARVMEESSADTLRSILRGVVEVGTATPVNSPVVSIAGKTGTAQIPDLVNKTYFQNRFIGSFAGFFPADRPLIAGIVMLEEPRPITYGGWTAGPAFQRIAERYSVLHPDFFAVPDLMLAERSDELDGTSEIPDLIGQQVALAETTATQCGLRLRSNADEGHVVWQYPPADRLVFEGSDILVAVQPQADSLTKMVDLRGLSVREASAFLKELGIGFRIKGGGRVTRQSIRPGHTVGRKAICQLECKPV